MGSSQQCEMLLLKDVIGLKTYAFLNYSFNIVIRIEASKANMCFSIACAFKNNYRYSVIMGII